MRARNQPPRQPREDELGAALVLALLVLAILTVVGIALALVTGTEARIAANEWSVNRAFYASDAGIRWGTVEMTDYQDFLARPEFTGSAFGTVLFQLPSHRIVYGVPGDVFSVAEDIAVRLQTPSLIGRRFAAGGRINVGSGYFYYSYEMRSASSDQTSGKYARALVAQVDVGPLPETAAPVAIPVASSFASLALPALSSRTVVFHSEPAVLLPPNYYQYVSSNLTPRTGACGNIPDCSYGAFRAFHRFRRRVAFVGSNDGFLHVFDPGTRREIFAFATKIMKASAGEGFPSLLDFPPKTQNFVDGSPVLADAFIDTQHDGTPNAANRTWKTVLVGGLGRGGRSYFALDVTQPPENGDGNSARYPGILWEMTDDCAPGSRRCVSPIGETWSRPVLGRIRVTDGSSAIRDRYVAIFGGGFDSTFAPGTEIDPDDNATRGRAIYIVDLETGTVIYKATTGQDADGNDVPFAPVPASPAVADVDDDGYLDVAYVGDLNGRMWRLDLRSGRCRTCSATDSLTGLRPFLLYDGMSASNTQKVQPVFLDAGLIFISGGPTPVLGVAWGTGYRAELLSENPNVHRFLFVVDEGGQATTFDETSLVNITPEGGDVPAARNRTCDTAPCGYFLDYASTMEKAVSSVFSTSGKLSLVTFRPKDANPPFGSGLSARYSFDYKTGMGTYGPSVKVSSYKEELGEGPASLALSPGSTGKLIDSVVYSTGSVKQKTAGGLTTLNNNWKEQ